MERYIHPKCYLQNSTESICTPNGLYDFENFSNAEITTIVDVLRIAFSNKYSKKLRSLGLLNECYTITYKARYILMELIVLLFNDSKKAYDALAVAEAYRSKGASFREQSIQKYEYYFQNTNFLQRKKINAIFALFSNRLLYHNLSELYEKEHNLYKALKYAKVAEKYNDDFLPLYPIHTSAILLKINPIKAVQYLETVLSNKKYRASALMIKKACIEARKKADKGYTYTPKKKKIPQNSVHLAIHNAAIQFLEYGKYYHLWHEQKP